MRQNNSEANSSQSQKSHALKIETAFLSKMRVEGEKCERVDCRQDSNQGPMCLKNQFKEGEEDFAASVGWLDRWKKRYGVRQLNICSEILSADTSAVQAFQKRIEDIILTEKLTPDQLYNCDETGLNFKMLPSKSLASKEENSAPAHKKRKERLTILACTNASGNHKMKLTVIGKSAKPRALKNITKEALPVHYPNQKSAWMNREIFKQWFSEHFVPETRKALGKKNLPCKAILFLDNAPSHPLKHVEQQTEATPAFEALADYLINKEK
ncbi:jerky protein homolog-like [Parasteatoda tepidariorum]|uniref:jerky protein homolog-like n=1 Tax=Parasteatoda tepidariorum TaxID=114398 RepID=UPI0039BC4455